MYFTRRANMERHVSTIHYKAYNFACSQCDQCFAHKYVLTKHINTVHEQAGDKLMKSPMCPEKILAKDLLTNHLQGHVNSERQLINLEDCKLEPCEINIVSSNTAEN